MDKHLLDRTDFGIIGLLQNNAWMPNKQVASAIGLAPSSCHERIRNLRASGVIRGAHAEIDRRALGLGLEALIFIKLTKYERNAIEHFLDEMHSIPEVRNAFLVNGRYDVVLHLVVQDVDHLRNLGLDRITSQPVVLNIESSIVYDNRSKFELPLPPPVKRQIPKRKHSDRKRKNWSYDRS